MFASWLAGPTFTDYFSETSWYVVLAWCLLLNVATTLSAAILWRVLVGRWVLSDHPNGNISTRALVLTGTTTLTNALVILPAWWLWIEGHLTLAAPSLGGALWQFLALTLFVDTAMYGVHRVFHFGVLYRWFHSWHHRDDSPSAVLLLVMHPFEASGFGLLILVAMLLVPLSVPAVAAFFGLNLVMGVCAHVPTARLGPVLSRFAPSRWVAGFHEQHHQSERTNFGFFTPLWDSVLGTRSG